MYEEAAMQDEPTRSKDEPLIHRHMRNLRKRAELLREQADILEGRLAPILGPNVQDVNKQAPALVAPEASDLARDLDGMHDTLSNVYGQVQRVLARLEI